MFIKKFTQEYGFLLVLSICCGLFHGTAFAALVEMPLYERLGAIHSSITAPTAVAVDNKGQLYIAQPGLNNVTVLSQSGKMVGIIENLAEPVSVAVSSDGTIYIGNRGKGNVEAYSPEFSLLSKLGSGDGEFAEPKDIVVDSGGNIYVADKDDHVIKMYYPDGSYKATLGTPGNNDGEFYQPISIAIDEAAGQLIVLDLQQVQDTYFPDQLIDGARLQKFNLIPDGIEFVQSFSKYGMDLDAGEMARPMHLEVDSQGRYYVSNCWPMSKVVVYDNAGNFLGLLDDNANSLKIPLGMALADSNRLYIVSSLNQQLDIYGLDNSYLDVQIDPLSLSAESGYGMVNQTIATTLSITNNGTVDFSWSAVSNDSWLTVSPSTAGGLLAVGTSAPVALNILDGLSIGTYHGSITITAGTSVQETVDVQLTIFPNYLLYVNPNTMAFETELGVTPMFQTVRIENHGTGILDWGATVDQSWLSLSAASGTAPSDLKILVDVSSLSVGNYNGHVTISVQGESNVGPVQVPVSLTVLDPPPVVPPPVDGPPPGSNWPGDSKVKWTVESLVDGISLHGIWGSSGIDIFAVGDEGTIVHHDGTTWNFLESGVSENIYAVWGSSSSDVFAVGEDGLILYSNGSDWSRVSPAIPSSLRSTLQSIWGVPGSEVYTAGNNSILGSPASSSWQILFYSKNIAALRGIWGTSDSDIYTVGDYGTILHYDGASWSFVQTGYSETLYAVWGSGKDDIFAVGEMGTILHYNGTSWQKIDTGTTATLRGIWGNSAYEIYAVGDDGIILRYDGSEWKIVEAGVTESLHDVWSGACNDIYAVSSAGSVIHGYASKFPWIMLRPILEYNANQMRLKEQEKAER